MIGPYRIEGYVIASADGRIADATGVMPPSLEHDADKRYFEEALESVAAVVHGRRSQEIHAKTPIRRRLILTQRVEALARCPDNPRAVLWNPAGAPFEAASAMLGVESGTIAIIGGPKVYSLFLKLGYDAFHLCRAINVRLPDGLPVFVRDLFGAEPDACLTEAGLRSAGDADAQRRGQPDGLDARLLVRLGCAAEIETKARVGACKQGETAPMEAPELPFFINNLIYFNILTGKAGCARAGRITGRGIRGRYQVDNRTPAWPKNSRSKDMIGTVRSSPPGTGQGRRSSVRRSSSPRAAAR